MQDSTKTINYTSFICNVEKVVFHNKENGYSVLSVTTDSESQPFSICGILNGMPKGSTLYCEGKWVEHAKFGRQFLVETWEDRKSIKPNEVAAADLARFIAEKTNHNLFLTGKAGTGKTVFLRDFVAHTQKKVVVLAPTGIAAINANAMTIHSFCRFGLAPNPGGKVNDQFDYILDKQEEELIRNLDMIIIDEVSMVRADLMDHISEKIRLIRCSKEPFGGVQLLLIGDLHQLPPVVTKEDEMDLKEYYKGNYFFFNSKAIRKVGFETVCLDKVYRQGNPDFVNILNRARVGKTTWEDCHKLNTRYQSHIEEDNINGYISLVAQRKQAYEINADRLERVEGKAKIYSATIMGDFPADSYPTLCKLKLKVGAQVMFVKNDKDNKYCNGTIGEIVELEDNYATVKVKGVTVKVVEESWNNIRYEFIKAKKKIQKETIGTFMQLPLKPAWAITVHKSQGLSFDHAIIDIPRAFAPGQSYVALSRCRSLEGLVLKKKMCPEKFYVDPRIASFYNKVDNVLHIAYLAEAVGYKTFKWDKIDGQDIKEQCAENKDNSIKHYWEIYANSYDDAFIATDFLMNSYHESASMIDDNFWEELSKIAGCLKNAYYRMVLYKELCEYVKEEAPTWQIIPEDD